MGRVAVCGEALVDVVDGVRRPGGSPFNTARGLARLGVPVTFISHLSDDADGREIARSLAAAGVSLELASTGAEPTTQAIARLGAAGAAEYEFIVEGTSAPQLTLATLPPRLPADIEAICVGSLGLVLEPMASTIGDLVARERSGRAVVVDPNVRPGLIPDADYRARLMRVLRAASVVKASDADLAWLFDGLGHVAAAERLLEGGAALVVVTLGAAGAFAAHREHRVAVPAVAVQVTDTIGAGDAFGAALLAWLHDRRLLSTQIELSEHELLDALRYASRAAAMALADLTR